MEQIESSVLPRQRSTFPPRFILETLLGHVPLDKFLNEFFRKQPFSSAGGAKQFCDLVNLSTVSEMIAAQHTDSWLIHRGRLPKNSALNTGKLSVLQAVFAYASGHTILLRHVEAGGKRFRDIAADFHHLFEKEIDIQIYGTPANEEGFDWHYDMEDVFVIQSQGRKEFRLIQNKRKYPRPHSELPARIDLKDESAGPEIRCLLHAGDWLYIPAGWWHKARAIEDSFHFSVGVARH